MRPMRMLRSVFFRPPDDDRERRLEETALRVATAKRMMDNALESQDCASRKLREARTALFDREMVDMIAQLSSRLGE